MTNYEESAKAYENDYLHAPVGMGVGSFWGGALLAGLTAFAMSTFLSKGWLPGAIIANNQRVVFADDRKGLIDGLIILAILLTLSICAGLAGRAAMVRKRELGFLWKISLGFIPVLTCVLTVAVIILNH